MEIEYIYLIIVVLLFIFAISDLIVGVSNDAVNFLNSGVGAKAASFRILMLIASIGVLVGVVFSGGMMEVARKGIFNPEQFFFHEIMLIFLAVMITDVILLDTFNTLGLPTSTTVSLIFELLGSAFTFSVIKIIQSGEKLLALSKYINSDRALGIIGAIFLSIVLAFTLGAIVMYLTRLLFSFSYKKYMRIFGSLYGGLSIAVICYFIFIKGLEAVTFISSNQKDWVNNNIFTILIFLALGLAILFEIIQFFKRIDVFRIVVLFGIFALAMAFAANDLVNFIGVPMAGYESFKIFQNSAGADPNSFLMVGLGKKVETNVIFLLLAGLIMVLALWFSRKARSVTKTSIDLSRQTEGEERFGSNQLSRAIARIFFTNGKNVNGTKESKLKQLINKRFEQPEPDLKDPNPPSFDMLRASMNLMIASILIAFGTSLKLPLSTTYVTFMVAMGASLSDRAWGRESAVYRISGVFTVISGWFLTAFIAFSVASIVVLTLFFGGIYAIVVIGLLVFYFLYRTHTFHKKTTKEKELKSDFAKSLLQLDEENLYLVSHKKIEETINIIPEIITNTFDTIETGNTKKLKQIIREVKTLNKKFVSQTNALNETIKTLDEKGLEWGEYFVKINESLKGMLVSLDFIVRPIYSHLINLHKTLNPNQLEDLKKLQNQLLNFITLINEYIAPDKPYNEELINNNFEELIKFINDIRKSQISRIKRKETPARSSLLFLTILSETRVLAYLLRDIYIIEKERIFR